MKVLIATEKPFAKKAVDQIREKIEKVGYELCLLEKYTDKQELINAVRDVSAMIVRSDIIDKEVIDAAKQMKIIVRAGAGYDSIDIEAAKNAGICVMNTPGQNANAVAELVFGLMVAAFRNFYNGTSGKELKGKKIGIHAYGNVGKNVARIAKGFEMDVMAYDAYYKANDNEGVTFLTSVEELYRSADFVSVNIPFTKETDKIVNKKLLSLMSEDAVIVNSARKEVIDEEDMLEHMLAHPKFKFITDIKPDNATVMQEKCPEQFFTTPKKMGAQTAEANINAGVAAANQIIDYIENGNEKFRVN